jgi:hypothetical protein
MSIPSTRTAPPSGEGRLAGARAARDAEDLAAVEGEADVVDGAMGVDLLAGDDLGEAAADAEFLDQRVDLQQACFLAPEVAHASTLSVLEVEFA